MKNLKLFAGLCLSMMATSAMAQQYMTVNFQDGKTVEYRLDDIKDVTFREAATIDPNEWQPTSVLGTVALGDNVDVNGWVTAIDARGFILSDLSGSILCYQASGFDVTSVKIGDQISVSSPITQYNTGLQIAISDGSYAVGANEAYSYPEAKEYTGAMMDEAVAREGQYLAEYVKFSGKCSVNGNYINFIVEGAETAQGSGYQVPDFIKEQLTDGEDYEIYGYFASVSSSRYFNVVITEVKKAGAPQPSEWEATSVLGSCKLGDNVKVNGWVSAIDARGFVLSDLSGSILCYQASGFDVESVQIGDRISVSAEIAQYNTGLQIAISDASYTVEGKDSYNYPAPKEYTGAMMDEAVAREGEYAAEYVKFLGTCSISDKGYINFTVEGAATAQGSGYQVPQSIKDQLANGETYEVYGYFVSVSSSRYFNVVITEVKKADAPQPSDWEATSVLGSCQVGDNVTVKGWVSAIDNRGFVLSDLSGSILCYQASGFDVASVALGDRISVTSEISQFNTGLQIAISDGSYTVEGKDSYNYPAPKEYTGAMMDEAVARSGEFLAEYVKFVGTCSISDKGYINFTVAGAANAQGSGYQVPQAIKDQLANGETYEVYGYFVSVSSSRYFNVVITKAEKVGSDVPEPVEWKATSVLGSCKLGDHLTVMGWVTAIDARGFVLTDLSGSILCYQASGFDVESVKIGDQIVVSSDITQYNTGLQIAISSGSYSIAGNEAYSYPEPKEYTGAMMDEAVAREGEFLAEYVKFVGECSISDKGYINFTVAGAETAQGSGYQVPQSIKDQLADGESFQVCGYFVSVSSSRYFNVVITEVK